MFRKIYCFFAWIAIKWWCFWSNIRFSDSTKSAKVEEDDICFTPEGIREQSKKVYKKFKYTNDGADQLWDAIVPPPQNYINYRDGYVYDDCDGFHSTMYHCVKNSIEGSCYLLSAVGHNAGHCLMAFWLNGWYILDYTKLYDPKESLEEAISIYNESYKSIYGGDVWFNALVEYNYSTGKFSAVKVSDAKRLRNGN